MKENLLYLLVLLLLLNSVKNDLFVDNSIKYANYEDFVRNPSAGNISIATEGIDFKVEDGIGFLTTKEIIHGLHSVNLVQVPPTSTINSHFLIGDIYNIKFKIKSKDITANEIKVFGQSFKGGKYYENSLIDLGYENINDWTEVKISPSKSFSGVTVKSLLGLSINGGALGRSIQIKDIALIDPIGRNLEVIRYIYWPKETGNDDPPEKEMKIGTKIKKNGIDLTLEWSDEFIQSDLLPDQKKWGYDIGDGIRENTDGTKANNLDWGNGEEQWYNENNENNAYVSDGTLKIRAVRETYKKKNGLVQEWLHVI